ncbi:MAG: heme NO-binding domain-containing protein [Myxococcota bacterium]
MMGMVFTELLEMVETKFSFETVDAIVARAGAKGSYTSVGNYDDGELFALVGALAEETGIAVPDLLYAYGQHLFGRFFALFPQFFTSHTTAPSFLAGLESHVHTEVRKLYPVAHPPLFTSTTAPDGSVLLEYRSPRGLWRFAQGLLEACLVHYGAGHRLGDIEDLSSGAGTHVRFQLLPA